MVPLWRRLQRETARPYASCLIDFAVGCPSQMRAIPTDWVSALPRRSNSAAVVFGQYVNPRVIQVHRMRGLFPKAAWHVTLYRRMVRLSTATAEESQRLRVASSDH